MRPVVGIVRERAWDSGKTVAIGRERPWRAVVVRDCEDGVAELCFETQRLAPVVEASGVNAISVEARVTRREPCSIAGEDKELSRFETSAVRESESNAG